MSLYVKPAVYETFLRRPSATPTAGDYVRKGTELGKGVAKKGLGIVGSTACIIGGFLSLIAGVVGATFFKDNTSADWLSKILMVLGAIFGGTGVYKLIRSNKDKESKAPCEGFTIDQNVANELNNLKTEIKKQDPQFQEDISQKNPCKVYTSNKDITPPLDSFRAKVLNYTNKLAQVIRPVAVREISDDHLIDNLREHEKQEPKSLGFYKEEIALGLGFYNSSGDNPADLNTQDPVVQALLQNNELDKDSQSLLPKDFNIVYDVARHYKAEHLNQNNSVASAFNFPAGISADNLSSRLKTGTNAEKIAAKTYLDKIHDVNNCLKILKKAVGHVIDNSLSQDPKIARNVAVLRAALILGFGLKGNNLSEIKAQLETILNGQTTIAPPVTGLKTKTDEQLKTQMDTLNKIFSSDPFPYTKEPYEFNQLFSKEMDCFDFKDKPVS